MCETLTSRMYGKDSMFPINGSCRKKVRITGKKSLDEELRLTSEKRR